jgi:hypothetical protein
MGGIDGSRQHARKITSTPNTPCGAVVLVWQDTRRPSSRNADCIFEYRPTGGNGQRVMTSQVLRVGRSFESLTEQPTKWQPRSNRSALLVARCATGLLLRPPYCAADPLCDVQAMPHKVAEVPGVEYGECAIHLASFHELVHNE